MSEAERRIRDAFADYEVAVRWNRSGNVEAMTAMSFCGPGIMLPLLGELTALRTANDGLSKELEAARVDAARYQHMRNLAMKQTAMPGQPFIVMYNGMQGVYNLIGEVADYAVDTSMAQAAIAQEAKP